MGQARTVALAIGTVAVFAAGTMAYSARGKTTAALPTAQVAPKALTGPELCVRDLNAFVQFKDPDSVKITSAEVSEMTHSVLLMVNAKNGFGGYTGAQVYSCDVDVPGQRVTAILAAADLPPR